MLPKTRWLLLARRFSGRGNPEEGQISTPERKLNIPAANLPKVVLSEHLARLFLFLVLLAAVGARILRGQALQRTNTFSERGKRTGCSGLADVRCRPTIRC